MSFYTPVIVGSVRRGRYSPTVARYIAGLLRAGGGVDAEILDLLEWDLPIMEERVRLRDDSPSRVLAFGEKLANADGLVVVTPEYNNGYPGILKNALDYFLPEYKRKPVGIVTVSSGGFGGLNALAQLRLVFLALGAYPIAKRLPVSRVQDAFDASGNPTTPALEKAAREFVEEFLWVTEALVAQKNRSRPPSS